MPTQEELKFLQSQSLERKIMITQTRIIEWYQHYEGKVYVSFSGGKDSTVLLDIARRIYPDIEAVFMDTGLEYPEIREFIKAFDNVTVVKPKMQFKEVIEKYGYPIIGKETAQAIYEARNKPDGAQALKFESGSKFAERYGARYSLARWKYLLDSDIPIGHMCCNVMKKKPAKDFGKRTGKKAIIGTMTDESRLREKSWLISGCNAFESKNPKSTPMSFWIEQDVLHYLKLTEIPYCSVYGDIAPKSEFIGQLALDDIPTDLITTGCQRTGCMFCGFGAHLEAEPNRFQKMKITHPKQYDYCMREENGLGMAKVLDYIGVKY
jgi:3'-phosphoadenosine 5'-phosphosulfate sulfotransferase (PAPS reductase)/FAD synthetase